MKVLMINGSPRPKGNTALALGEMETVFKVEGMLQARFQAFQFHIPDYISIPENFKCCCPG